LRFTVDTPEDLELANQVYAAFDDRMISPCKTCWLPTRAILNASPIGWSEAQRPF
jgi:hypothetical protein